MCLSDVGVSKAKSKNVKERNANVVGVVLVQHSNTVCFIFHTNRATEKRAYENLIYLSDIYPINTFPSKYLEFFERL